MLSLSNVRPLLRETALGALFFPVVSSEVASFEPTVEHFLHDLDRRLYLLVLAIQKAGKET